VQKYLKVGSTIYNSNGLDLLGHDFYYGSGRSGGFSVDHIPNVSVETYQALSDVAPLEFWSPYNQPMAGP